MSRWVATVVTALTAGFLASLPVESSTAVEHSAV